MEAVIKHIIDIDKKAETISRETKERIKEIEENTSKKIEEMKNKMMSEACIKADKILKSAVKEALSQASEIQKDSQEEISAIDRNYMGMEESLGKELFNKIVNDSTGDCIE